MRLSCVEARLINCWPKGLGSSQVKCLEASGEYSWAVVTPGLRQELYLVDAPPTIYTVRYSLSLSRVSTTILLCCLPLLFPLSRYLHRPDKPASLSLSLAFANAHASAVCSLHPNIIFWIVFSLNLRLALDLYAFASIYDQQLHLCV